MRSFGDVLSSWPDVHGGLGEDEAGWIAQPPEVPRSILPGHGRVRHQQGVAASFIRRCWFPERGCDESSTCSDLRAMWEGAREDVKILPPPAECGRPTYIVTGASKPFRHGLMDENRLETLMFPGERWHKCCIIPPPEDSHFNAKPRMVCEHLKTVDRQKLMQEMRGWCGPHKCINPRDRCLVVDEEKIDGFKAEKKGDCPKACSKFCNKLTQKFECIYIGNEPKFPTEGSETPKKMFNENEQYDVFSLSTTAPEPPLEASESCAPVAAVFMPPPVLAVQGASRHKRWRSFLS